jgi:hypothetical protein
MDEQIQPREVEVVVVAVVDDHAADRRRAVVGEEVPPGLAVPAVDHVHPPSVRRVRVKPGRIDGGWT